MLSLSPERLQVLQDRVLLFDGFSGDEVMQLLQHANKKTIGDGELIVEEGLDARSMFILISGQAVVSRQHGSQVETLAILEPGATVGEMAMVDSAPRSAQVAARGTAIVLEFGPDALSPAPPFSCRNVSETYRSFWRADFARQTNGWRPSQRAKTPAA